MFDCGGLGSGRKPKTAPLKAPARSNGIRAPSLTVWRIAIVLILLLKVIYCQEEEELETADNMMDGQTEEQYLTLRQQWDKCEDRMVTERPPDDGFSYCNMTFDTWDCWNFTRAGNTSVQPCPAWIPNSNPVHYASKICNPDGTWFQHPETNNTWTNYTQCQNNELVSTTDGHIVYYLGYSLSVISLCIASFIFFYFRSLGCPRVTIHKNLFVSFILCGTVWINWFALVTQNPELVKDNPVFCKVLLILGQYFNTCNYFWMLSEGLYLHTVIVVAVFSENHTLYFYYIIGWVLPLIPVCIYTGFMVKFNTGLCWLTPIVYEWFIAGFIILVLIINLCLLLNIVRVLVTKLRATPSSGSINYTRAVRATLILLPLLGLHYIIMPVRPTGNTVIEAFYTYFMAVLLSFQGFFVACIFCFFNGEVKMQIRRKWYSYRWGGHRGSTFGGRYGNMNTTITETISTVPPNDRRSIDKGQHSPLLNKAPPPVLLPNGNGRMTGSETTTTTATSTAPGGEGLRAEDGTNPMSPPPLDGNGWDCNANPELDGGGGCPSILIIDHDAQDSVTTEV